MAADPHTCTAEECGSACHLEDGQPINSYHVVGAPDSGGFDADDQPCRCPEHDDVRF